MEPAAGQFVENPRKAVAEADVLVTRLMAAKGYPMTDFESLAAYASVDHPRVISDYRQAHQIAERDQREAVDTESLRRALICYRNLFDDLLVSPVLERCS